MKLLNNVFMLTPYVVTNSKRGHDEMQVYSKMSKREPITVLCDKSNVKD